MDILNKTNYILNRTLCLGLLAGLVACNGDDGQALLSSLWNQRMVVLLKGTYATDNPLPRGAINNNRLFVDADDRLTELQHQAETGCAPYVDPTCLPAYDALPIFLDLGELRMSTRSPLSDLSEITNGDDAEKFWNVLSVERQVYCSTPYSIDFDNTCTQTGGLINFLEFTNGRGAVYPAYDIPAGVYLHAGVYVRALAFGFGRNGGVVGQDRFDNRDILGTNVIPLVQYDPNVDDLTQQLLPPQWFPLHHKVVQGQESSVILDHGEYTAVLEIRWNMMENLMVHNLFNNATSVDNNVVAFSDWRRPHDDDGTDQGFNMGGNVLTRSRIYYPNLTSTLYVDGGVESTRHYYGLYITNEELKGDNLPLAATPVYNGSGNELKHIMSGSYVVQCRYDCNNDGYPELELSQSAPFVMGQGPGIASVSHPCGCGIDTATVSANSCVAHSGCY